MDGRVQKIFKERALLEQAFIKDTSKTVAEHIKAQVATIGENIQVMSHAQGAEYLCNPLCAGKTRRHARGMCQLEGLRVSGLGNPAFHALGCKLSVTL